MSDETKVEETTNDDDNSISQPIAKPNVVNRFLSGESNPKIGSLPSSPFFFKRHKDFVVETFNKIGYTDYKIYEVFRIEIDPKQDYKPPTDIELTEHEQGLVDCIVKKRGYYEENGLYKEPGNIKI